MTRQSLHHYSGLYLAKHVNSPAGWVLPKFTIHKETQAIDGFTHIRWSAAQKDFHSVGLHQHVSGPVGEHILTSRCNVGP